MSDRYAVIWTRAGVEPVKMGNLVVTDRECRFSYTKEFLDSGLPGFSLLAPPDRLREAPLVHQVRTGMLLHPRLMAMIPPDNPGNIQRQIFNKILDRKAVHVAPGFETEWALLLLAGHNGIGHLDVFKDDQTALKWYAERRTVMDGGRHTARSKIWRILRDEIRQLAPADGDVAALASILGPTPSVGGMVSKILMAIPDKEKWNGDFAAPGTLEVGGQRYVDVLVKIEQPHYQGLLDLEELCLDVHRELGQQDFGFDVPRSWRLDVDDLRLLAVERFDRDQAGRAIPFESLLSVFASGSKKVTSSTDLEWPEVGRWIDKLGQICNLDVRAAQKVLFHRLAVALMTGNGDMHLDNLGLLGGTRDARLSPVYDPAPMRAWPRHDLRMAIPIDFQHGIPAYEQIARTGAAFGIPVKQAKDILTQAAEATKDFTERVMALEDVPIERRQHLVEVVQKERRQCLGDHGDRPAAAPQQRRRRNEVRRSG